METIQAPADEVDDLLSIAPPLGHPDRAAWNRRLDEALGQGAAKVAVHARSAKGEALRHGDRQAAITAGVIERRARRAIDAGKV